MFVVWQTKDCFYGDKSSKGSHFPLLMLQGDKTLPLGLEHQFVRTWEVVD